MEVSDRETGDEGLERTSSWLVKVGTELWDEVAGERE